MQKQLNLPPDREIAALIPIYTGNGDATRLIMMNGEEQLLPYTLRSVMKKIAHRSCKDIVLMREWSAKCTSRSLNNPLPVNALLVLTPFKARLPLVEGDEVMGCVNPLAVKHIEKHKIKPLPAAYAGQKRPKQQKSEIIMKSGQKIASYWSAKILADHIKDGELIQNKLVQEMDENVIYFLKHRSAWH